MRGDGEEGDLTAAAQLWVDKYRPETLDDYVLNPDLKGYFRSMIANRSLQNFTCAGVQGSGKTSLVKLMAREFGAETLFVKCATDGTLDVLRTKIADFCNAMPVGGGLKVVVLDELDSASSSGQNNFQMGLRTTIEAAQDDTRFLCTANYSTKILPAILSRCPIIPLQFDKRDLLQRVKFILDSEKVRYGKESLKAFIEEAFSFYPDCRRIISYLQLCCGSGELVVRLGRSAGGEKGEFLSALMEKTVGKADLLEVRKFYLAGKDRIPDYVAFGSDVYNWVVDRDIVTEDGVLALTDQLYQLNTVIDKEAGLFGMLCATRKFKKEG